MPLWTTKEVMWVTRVMHEIRGMCCDLSDTTTALVWGGINNGHYIRANCDGIDLIGVAVSRFVLVAEDFDVREHIRIADVLYELIDRLAHDREHEFAPHEVCRSFFQPPVVVSVQLSPNPTTTDWRHIPFSNQPQLTIQSNGIGYWTQQFTDQNGLARYWWSPPADTTRCR
jgi:hypothetical protein